MRLVPRLLCTAALALATAAAFSPCLKNDFVDFDDKPHLVENIRYRGFGRDQLRWMFSTNLGGQYQPLTWLSFGLDHRIWGVDAFGYHLTNVILHVLNVLLFWGVCARLLETAWPRGPGAQTSLRLGAAFAALLFGVHPLRVESVAWAIERKDVLSGFFYLSALIAYLEAAKRSERRRLWLGSSLTLFGLSLLSKPMAVSLPLTLLILDLYPLRRLSLSSWNDPAGRAVLLEKIPYAATAVAAALVTYGSQVRFGAAGASPGPASVVTPLYGLMFYIGKTLWPTHLSALYPLPNPFIPWTPSFLASGAAVAVITSIVLAGRRRFPAGLAAWAFYVVTLAPVSGLIPFGQQLAADRYSYLPCLGWAALAGAGMTWCLERGGILGRWIAPAVGAVLIATLVTLTRVQTSVWRNTGSLWAQALEADPGNAVAHFGLGMSDVENGRIDAGIAHYRAALARHPGYAEARNNLGRVLMDQHRWAEALVELRQAVRIKPGFALAHLNLAHALVASRGPSREAFEHYREALRINPDDAEARNYMGMDLLSLGAISEAEEQFREALRLKPSYPDAHNNLATVLSQSGRDEEAVARLREALRLKPDYAQAHYNLGLWHHRRGRVAQAITEYRQALLVRPDDAQAHNNLGVALVAAGRSAEGIAEYRAALRVQPDLQEARRNLSMALQGQGKVSRPAGDARNDTMTPR